MLSAQDNALMCKVGPGTGMGAVMRQTWLPALLSSELTVGGDPVHVQLLGEDFVAFRDGDGNVGLLDEMCCHRGASLTVGRVENCGLRCIYHGWLFAADGKVLETPNVTEPKFKERFTAKAYPVREAGGLVWVFLGERQDMPPFPDYPFMHVPESNLLPTLVVINANFVQVMEGIFDSSHLTLLHSSALAAAASNTVGNTLNFVQATAHMQFEAAPKIEAELTDFGFHYSAIRMLDGRQETRVTSFIAPCFQLNPNGDLFSALVPMADGRTAFFQLWFSETERMGEEPLASKQKLLVGLDEETLVRHGQTRKTCDGPNRMSRQNGWHQDREAMRRGHFSGMHSFIQDDAVCVVTGGSDGIRDRSKERLSTADMAVGMIYRVLLRCARNVQEGGRPVAHGLDVSHVRGAHATLEPGTDWRTIVPQHAGSSKKLEDVAIC